MLKKIKENIPVIIAAIAGLAISWDLAVIMLILQTIGIIAVVMLASSVFLDDRNGKGLFPTYDEDKLINTAGLDPVGAAITIFTKNAFLLGIIYMAFKFLKP